MQPMLIIFSNTADQIAKRGGDRWGPNEIDAALLAIDECQDGYIDEEEFVEWFKLDIWEGRYHNRY